MADELEPLHAAALAEVVAKLKAAPGVAALVPEQVFGPDAESLAHAGEWARCVTVSAGKRHGAQKAGAVALLVQRDAWIECRAESDVVRNMLASAVVHALNGCGGGKAFQHCIHSDNFPAKDGPGEPPQHVSITHVFGLFCAMPKDPQVARATAAPPPKLTPPAAPPRLKPEKRTDG